VPSITSPLLQSKTFLISSYSWRFLSKSSGSSSISASTGYVSASSSAGGNGLNPLVSNLLLFLISFSEPIVFKNSFLSSSGSSLNLLHKRFVIVVIPLPLLPKIMILGLGGSNGREDLP